MLAIVAMVLVVLALQRIAGTDAADQMPARFRPSTRHLPRRRPPRQALTPSPTTAPLYDRSQERFLSVGNGVMWRGVAGLCGDVEPLLERSVDSGETWTDVTPDTSRSAR